MDSRPAVDRKPDLAREKAQDRALMASNSLVVGQESGAVVVAARNENLGEVDVVRG